MSVFKDIALLPFRNKPRFKVLIAWGGNLTRGRNQLGTLSQVITASSQNASYPKERVFDGKRPHIDPADSTFNGWWQSLNTSDGSGIFTTPEWIQIDFGKQKTFNRIVLYHQPLLGALKDFKFQYSNNGVSYTDITETITTGNTAIKHTFTLTNSITSRYLRLYITKTVNLSDYARACEIEAYNFADESTYIYENSVNITQKKEQVTNKITQATFDIAFSDLEGFNLSGVLWGTKKWGEFRYTSTSSTGKRYSPLNENSPIYGDKQIDNFGFIRANTPIEIYAQVNDYKDVVYEKALLTGFIGSETDPAANTGIVIDTSARTATVIGEDFVKKIINSSVTAHIAYEGYSVEDLMRQLGYMANVAYADMDFEATGSVIPYAYFENDSVWNIMQKIVEAQGVRLYPLANGTLRIVVTNPYRSWQQDTQADWQSGVYGAETIDLDSFPGYVRPKPQSEQSEYELWYGSVFQSQVHDLTAQVVAFGSLEAKYNDAGQSVIFKTQTSNDNITYDAEVAVIAGSIITSAVKRYIRVRIYFNTLLYSAIPNVDSITVNFILSVSAEFDSWELKDSTNLKTGQVQIGNARANRVKVVSNPLILQVLTNYPTTTYWKYSDIPFTVLANTTRTIIADFTDVSIKSTGGNTRHLYITADAVSVNINDGASSVVGNSTVTFKAYAKVAYITITTAGLASTVTDMAIDARALKFANDIGQASIIIQEDTVSQDIYGQVYEMAIDNPYIPSDTFATNLAVYLLNKYKYAKHYATGISIPIIYPSMQDTIIMTQTIMIFNGKQFEIQELRQSGNSLTTSLAISEI